MSIPELIHLYFDRSTALQGYWTLYVVIIGGVLAFSSLRQRPSWVTTVLIAVLYACFAYKNLGAIRDTTFQRLAVLNTLKAANERDSQASWLLPTLDVPDYGGVKRFHVFCDALTVATLIAFELRRRRYRREDTPL
jgi:hypothetical protein